MGVLRISAIQRINANKVRVTFSEPVNATSLTTTNYTLTGLGNPFFIAQVSSTQVDLHYGSYPGIDANTVARWTFDDPINTFSLTPIRTAAAGAFQRSWNTYQNQGYGTVSGNLDSAGPYHLYKDGQYLMVESADPIFNPGVTLCTSGINNTLAFELPGAYALSTQTITFKARGISDTSGNGYFLNELGPIQFVENGIMGRGRQFGQNSYTAAYSNATLTPRTDMLGTITVDALVTWDGNRTALADNNFEDIISYSGSTTAGQTENTLMRLCVSTWSGQVSFFWENGAGTLVGVTKANSQVSLVPGVPTLVTVKREVSGSTMIVSIYINGELRQVVTEKSPLPDGGTSGFVRWGIGAHPNSGISGGAVTNPFYGEIAFVRVSNIGRSDSSIKTYSDSLMNPLSSLGSLELQVQNVEDSASSTPILLANGYALSDIFMGEKFVEDGDFDVSSNISNIDSSPVWASDAILGEIVDSLGATPPVVASFYTVSKAVSPTSIVLTLNDDVFLDGPAADPSYWVVSGGTTPVTVTGVSAVGTNITVTFTEPKGGEALTLHLPLIGIKNANTQGLFDGSFQELFTSQAVSPVAVMAQVLDRNTIRISYSEPVQTPDAINPANYSIDNGLLVTGIVQESSTTYLITTTNQVAGTLYTVTVINVKDLKGNVV